MISLRKTVRPDEVSIHRGQRCWGHPRRGRRTACSGVGAARRVVEDGAFEDDDDDDDDDDGTDRADKGNGGEDEEKIES